MATINQVSPVQTLSATTTAQKVDRVPSSKSRPYAGFRVSYSGTGEVRFAFISPGDTPPTFASMVTNNDYDFALTSTEPFYPVNVSADVRIYYVTTSGTATVQYRDYYTDVAPR